MMTRNLWSSVCFALRSVPKELNLPTTFHFVVIVVLLAVWAYFDVKSRAVRYSPGINNRTLLQDFFKNLEILSLTSAIIFESISVTCKHLPVILNQPL